MPDGNLESPFGTGSRAAHPARCSSYAAGHAVHPVRVRLCEGSPADTWVPVLVMGVVGDVVTLAAGDVLHRYRNHDTVHLATMVGRVGPDALLNLRCRMLFLRSWPRDAGSVFSLQSADEPGQACRP